MLTNDEIIASVKSAFLPLSCDAQIWDYDSKLRFRIRDYGTHIVRMDEVPLFCAQDEELLQSVLQRVRQRVQSKGYRLN